MRATPRRCACGPLPQADPRGAGEAEGHLELHQSAAQPRAHREDLLGERREPSQVRHTLLQRRLRLVRRESERLGDALGQRREGVGGGRVALRLVLVVGVSARRGDGVHVRRRWCEASRAAHLVHEVMPPTTVTTMPEATSRTSASTSTPLLRRMETAVVAPKQASVRSLLVSVFLAASCDVTEGWW